jgi:hypothetical protein
VVRRRGSKKEGARERREVRLGRDSEGGSRREGGEGKAE